ncbi:MAG: type III pantothenate kinase [Candidatus Sumerlaeia bacterium]|nr:type III pantothenate kinase [Candidatus Sumerlaeia bacterium]
MRLLLVDAGNTTLRACAARQGRPGPAHIGPSSQLGDPRSALDEWLESQAPFAEGACLAIGREAWRGSVRERLRRLGCPRVFFVDHDGPLPFRIHYTPGARTGADRIANIAAMRSFGGGPAVAVDFGTATNIDVLGPEGDFLGGAILPGARVALEALRERTAGRLPIPEPGDPAPAIGHSTAECLALGGWQGHLRAVEGIVADVWRALGVGSTPLHLTGGLAQDLAPSFRLPHRVDAELTLRGLAALWESVGRAHAEAP